ncbi:MAG TPA: phenylalanine--tRNA ligase beta subunit-related protein [Candidatus Polarisedimenticolia bacterium]|nr:phenylalanine--tRNA ligase beta subunit-related protein [Candidatus Polarisedimenticolia bacterium]
MWEPATRIEIDEDARRLVRAGTIHAAPVAIGPAGAGLLGEIEAACASLAAEHAGKAPGEIPGLAAARELYRAFGIDPTRTRPSSEALLRRVLQGKGLPRISNAVDLCNLLALRYLLPIGLYDAALIAQPVRLRRGRPGESYPGIRKEDVRLEGRPTLTDAHSPFGNPSSDSLRTSVTEATRALVMVIFAPAGYAAARLREHVEDARLAIARHLAPTGVTVVTSESAAPAD